jgi:hypothetical protein
MYGLNQRPETRNLNRTSNGEEKQGTRSKVQVKKPETRHYGRHREN